jgi:hypothetical protein
MYKPADVIIAVHQDTGHMVIVVKPIHQQQQEE